MDRRSVAVNRARLRADPAWRSTMPRLRYIDEAETSAQNRQMIEAAKITGAPDPRDVSIMVRNPKAGVAWVEYGNKGLYHGGLAHRVTEMSRIKMSEAHECD